MKKESTGQRVHQRRPRRRTTAPSSIASLCRGIADLITYLPPQFQLLRERLAAIEQQVGDIKAGLLLRAGVTPSGPPADSGYRVYDLTGSRRESTSAIEALRGKCANYNLFVDWERWHVSVDASQPKRELSRLQMALLAYKLQHFREWSDVDDVHAEVWGSIGIERNGCDAQNTVRSAVHDLNQRFGAKHHIYLRVAKGRVFWAKPFNYCLVLPAVVPLTATLMEHPEGNDSKRSAS